MSQGIKYVVDIDLVISGAPAGKLQTLGGHASKLGAEMGRVGGRLLDGFTGAVESIGGKLVSIGKMGGAALLGGAVYGAAKLNNELETTQVSLAAILNAKGMTSTMEGGMQQAAAWMSQMRKDARDLPGEFEDLKGIVASAAGSAFEQGMNVQNFEKMASQAMAAGKSMAVPLDQAGRELAQLLEGRAGAHNVFGMRLGIHAQGFNDKGGEERVKILQAALQKFEPAIAVFGETFDAQSSAFIDNAKLFIGAATGPLFGRMKDTLKDVNAWFDANQATVTKWSSRVGDFLAEGFDRGKAIILEYWPPFVTFATNAKDKLVSIWETMLPYVRDFGTALKGFLSDNGSIDKLIVLGKVYAAVKLGGAASGLLGGFGKVGAGMGGAGGGALSLLGAAGGAMTLGGIGYGVGSMTGVPGAGAMLGGGLAGGQLGNAVGGAPGAAIGAAGGVLIGSFIGVAEAAQGLTDANRLWYEEQLRSAKDLVGVNGMIDQNGKAFAAAVAEAESSASLLSRIFTDISGDMRIAAINLDTERFRQETAAKHNAGVDALLADIDRVSAVSRQKSEAEQKKFDADRKKKAIEGKGGTTIHKVEITVSSNQAPNQIARDVMSEMTNARRYRTSSPRTANFATGR